MPTEATAAPDDGLIRQSAVGALTVQQVSERLNMNPRTVQRWLAAGRLPGVRIGRRWRVRAADIDALLEGGR